MADTGRHARPCGPSTPASSSPFLNVPLHQARRLEDCCHFQLPLSPLINSTFRTETSSNSRLLSKSPKVATSPKLVATLLCWDNRQKIYFLGNLLIRETRP